MVDVQEEAGVPINQRKTMKLVKINDAGVAVGCNEYTRSGEGCGHAVRYDGVTRTLTTLPDFGFSAGATNVSADGRTVTGVIYDSGLIGRAAIWRDGEPRLVGLLGGHSMAMSVNSQGTVVGHLGQLHGNGAWMRREGESVTMLDSLVPDSGWELTEADGVSDRDEIVGSGVIDGQTRAFQLNLGPCRVCVTDVQLQQRDLPSGAWQDIGAEGTVDGNRVQVRVQVANHDDQPHVFQLKARDETRKEPIDEAPTLSLAPGEDEWVELSWDTDGSAWKDGAPDPDHVLRVRAVLGHTIFGGRSAVAEGTPAAGRAYPRRPGRRLGVARLSRAPASRQPGLGGLPGRRSGHGPLVRPRARAGHARPPQRGARVVRRPCAQRGGRPARRPRRPRARRPDRAPVDPGCDGRRRRPPPGPARDPERGHAVRRDHRRRGLLRPAA